MDFVAEKTFDKVNELSAGEYELCVFTGCDFSNKDFSGCKFIECEFKDCNLSNAKIAGVIFRDVKFHGCKLLGLMFNSCSDFGFSVGFENCYLQHGSFYKKKMKGANFKNTRLAEVDFTECDLTKARFEGCDFAGATFDRTILEKSDFQSSFNYIIDPQVNKIKNAKFSLTGIPGLLLQYEIVIVA
jgi:fluoroquinolone resistance protein